MVALYEKLRPTSIDEFLGFAEPVEQLVSMRDSIGWDGQVFCITGGSGNGKTTLARIIAAEVANEFETEEVDAQDLDLDTLRDWERRCAYCPTKQAHAFIVNEYHTLNTRVVSHLQTSLETPAVQKRGTFVFTSTNKGQQRFAETRFDAHPFLSRAIIVDLQLDAVTLQLFAEYLQSVATSLNLNGKPLSAYFELLEENQGNMRAALQAVASGKMKGKNKVTV